MTREIRMLEPEPGWNPFANLPRHDPVDSEFWAEDKFIRIADCPRCVVCDGRRVWAGFRSRWGGWQPCIVCNGHGRMPFICAEGE